MFLYDTPKNDNSKQEEVLDFCRETDEKTVREHGPFGSKGYDMFYSLMRE